MNEHGGRNCGCGMNLRDDVAREYFKSRKGRNIEMV
jgi:hypothetical protein